MVFLMVAVERGVGVLLFVQWGEETGHVIVVGGWLGLLSGQEVIKIVEASILELLSVWVRRAVE